MRNWVVAAGVLMSGCAAAPQTRFQTSTPLVLDPNNGAHLATDVRALAEAHKSSLSGCFDRLAERTDTDRLQAVAMTFTVRDATATLTGVRPENQETIVDTDLASCLNNALVDWRLLPQDQAEVQLSLRVAPQRAPSRLPAGRDVASTSFPAGWHPSE